MWIWLANQYAKRIVNINVNITIASLSAIVLTSVVLFISRLVGVTDEMRVTILVITFVSDWVIDIVVAIGLHWLANHWPKTWRRSRELLDRADRVMEGAPSTVLTVLKDAHADALLPPIAHGFDGGVPGGKAGTTTSGPATQRPEISFARDATMIQLQRLCLSPLFYAIAVGGMYWLLHHPEIVGREAAFWIASGSAIVVTRIIHTYWMLKTDPIAQAEWRSAFGLPAAEPTPTTPTTPAASASGEVPGAVTGSRPVNGAAHDAPPAATPAERLADHTAEAPRSETRTTRV